GPGTGPGRVIRSGSWFYDANYCRSAYRSYQLQDVGNGAIGFRLMREAD
ncbi:MAG: formylglycine-generating enzyme family protein, partial [Candidatus Hydrogenedentes bacterium]|nr:formylglycine-generating enzyme family protein [Candidatus Hydrogenedentota bacterium]